MNFYLLTKLYLLLQFNYSVLCRKTASIIICYVLMMMAMISVNINITGQWSRAWPCTSTMIEHSKYLSSFSTAYCCVPQLRLLKKPHCPSTAAWHNIWGYRKCGWDVLPTGTSVVPGWYKSALFQCADILDREVFIHATRAASYACSWHASTVMRAAYTKLLFQSFSNSLIERRGYSVQWPKISII